MGLVPHSAIPSTRQGPFRSDVGLRSLPQLLMTALMGCSFLQSRRALPSCTSKGGATGANEGCRWRVIQKWDNPTQFCFILRPWAPTVETKPLGSVPCVYSTCIKETFISPGQIINTFLQRWEGRGLALEEKKNIITNTVKSCLRCKRNRNTKASTSKSSGWLNTKVFAQGSISGWLLVWNFPLESWWCWRLEAFVGTHSQYSEP